MDDPLSHTDLATFGRLGTLRYCAEVVRLFQSDRATGELWAALAHAILHVSESSAWELVIEIDREILRHLEAIRGEA